MNVAFRVDASPLIGTGHLMRCMTLARELANQGASVCFVCRQIPLHLQKALQQEGIELRLIQDVALERGEHIEWLGGSQYGDAMATCALLGDKVWDWLIVDQYALDITWEKEVRHVAGHLCVIDDLADRSHDCDVLLDQNFYLDQDLRYSGKVPERCRLLLGTGYALLRKEFQSLSGAARARRGEIRTLLVFFGGIDRQNYTTMAIDTLRASLDVQTHVVHVVVGLSHPNLDEIKASCDAAGFHCHVQTQKMAQLIAQSDVVIGAGGSACWEFCALGVPPLIVITAENQRQLANDLCHYGAGRLVGDYREFSRSGFEQGIATALASSSANESCSRKALALFPEGCNGAQRVAQELWKNV